MEILRTRNVIRGELNVWRATTDFDSTIEKWRTSQENPHDDDLESVLKRVTSLLKILILSFIQAEHLAKSAANYSLIMEVIQKVVEREK